MVHERAGLHLGLHGACRMITSHAHDTSHLDVRKQLMRLTFNINKKNVGEWTKTRGPGMQCHACAHTTCSHHVFTSFCSEGDTPVPRAKYQYGVGSAAFHAGIQSRSDFQKVFNTCMHVMHDSIHVYDTLFSHRRFNTSRKANTTMCGWRYCEKLASDHLGWQQEGKPVCAHTTCSFHMFTPHVHTTCSCHVFVPCVHTTCSHHMFTPHVHATCS
jgi:hypothetical protein